MIRAHLAQQPGWGDRDFRWRAGEVSRVESLSDAVFALALALLFVSSEFPQDYRALAKIIEDFPALLVCFTFLMMPWWAHFKFFRRFGMQDLWTTVLNAALLFLVLFYVYPLKFLFTSLADGLFGFEDSAELARRFRGARHLMVVYGGGFVGIFAMLALLNLHGYRLRERFELNDLESYLTLAELVSHLLMVGVGLASIVMSLAGIHPFYCGMVYASLGPLHGIYGYLVGRTVRRLRAAATA
ncbi:MAG: TMEM175 family protein [Planctomycetota bacterium]